MDKIIRKNRQRINKDLKNPDKRKYFSADTYGCHITTVPAIEKYAKGRLIDIGCGDVPFKEYILPKVEQYDTFDIEKRTNEVKYIGDIHDMHMLKNSSYDTALCLEVLEHVSNPFQALKEIHRILKKNGILILSVPHLSRLHEEPHDYFRFTKYGLKTSLENTGFEIQNIKEKGGLFSFLGHQISTLFLCSLWHIPVLKHIGFFINKWIFVKFLVFLDNLTDKRKLFALGYTVVAEKK